MKTTIKIISLLLVCACWISASALNKGAIKNFLDLSLDVRAGFFLRTHSDHLSNHGLNYRIQVDSRFASILIDAIQFDQENFIKYLDLNKYRVLSYEIYFSFQRMFFGKLLDFVVRDYGVGVSTNPVAAFQVKRGLLYLMFFPTDIIPLQVFYYVTFRVGEQDIKTSVYYVPLSALTPSGSEPKINHIEFSTQFMKGKTKLEPKLIVWKRDKDLSEHIVGFGVNNNNVGYLMQVDASWPLRPHLRWGARVSYDYSYSAKNSEKKADSDQGGLKLSDFIHGNSEKKADSGASSWHVAPYLSYVF